MIAFLLVSSLAFQEGDYANDYSLSADESDYEADYSNEGDYGYYLRGAEGDSTSDNREEIALPVLDKSKETAGLDLEQSAQEFVLETKKILIPGYPHAFNPSITRWQGSLLLSFRIYHSVNRTAHRIGLVRLDDQLNLIEKPQILRFRFEDSQCIQKRQDPRLFTLGDRLFIVYNNVLDMSKKPEIRRMLMAEIHEDEEGFIVGEAEPFFHFEDESLRRSEKNWVAFDNNGQLFFAYSIFPHRILAPLASSGSCKTIVSTFSPLRYRWNFGTLRGGTPALKIETREKNEYLAFFHSSKDMATVHSKGQVVQHYFMGAYTFSDTYPFDIQRISPEPIVGKEFYHGDQYATWKPMCVVFPGGFVSDDKTIWLAYGRQDHEVWIAKLDKEQLLDSLVTCGQP